MRSAASTPEGHRPCPASLGWSVDVEQSWPDRHDVGSLLQPRFLFNHVGTPPKIHIPFGDASYHSWKWCLQRIAMLLAFVQSSAQGAMDFAAFTCHQSLCGQVPRRWRRMGRQNDAKCTRHRTSIFPQGQEFEPWHSQAELSNSRACRTWYCMAKRAKTKRQPICKSFSNQVTQNVHGLAVDLGHGFFWGL